MGREKGIKKKNVVIFLSRATEIIMLPFAEIRNTEGKADLLGIKLGTWKCKYILDM